MLVVRLDVRTPSHPTLLVCSLPADRVSFIYLTKQLRRITAHRPTLFGLKRFWGNKQDEIREREWCMHIGVKYPTCVAGEAGPGPGKLSALLHSATTRHGERTSSSILSYSFCRILIWNKFQIKIRQKWKLAKLDWHVIFGHLLFFEGGPLWSAFIGIFRVFFI